MGLVWALGVEEVPRVGFACGRALRANLSGL